MLRIASLNVNGMKAFYNRGVLPAFLSQYDPDILCFQETKCSASYAGYWLCEFSNYTVVASENRHKPGYSGVAMMIRKSLARTYTVTYPSFEDINSYYGGRVIVLEFDDHIVLNVYTLNSGEKEELRQQWDVLFLALISQLKQKGKPVIIMGDLNVCYQEVDHYNRAIYYDCFPSCYQFEMDGMTNLLGLGFTDIHRQLHPDERKYTYFSWKGNAYENNKGWRLDYPIISNELIPHVLRTEILDDVKMSDHYPIFMDLDIPKRALYTHHVKGGEYYLADTCKIQIDDVWHPAYVYRDHTGESYARTLQDFHAKFTKLE